MLLLDRSQLGAHRASLIAVWNAATAGNLPLQESLWLQNVENSPLYQDGDCLVYEQDGQIAGFAIIRTLSPEILAANPDMGDERERGHIMALAVHPHFQFKGIGAALLDVAEKRLQEMGATSVTLSGPSDHLVPGPIQGFGNTEFWSKHGFEQNHTTVDLRHSLDDWQMPDPPPRVATGEFSCRQGQPGEEDAILAWLAENFPGRWRFDAANLFARGYSPADITLMIDANGAIEGFLNTYHANSAYIGPSIYWSQLMRPGVWGGVGPLGVSRNLRGGGNGIWMVASGVDYLYNLGVRDCGIDWTTLVEFYGRVGFKPWKYWLGFADKQLS